MCQLPSSSLTEASLATVWKTHITELVMRVACVSSIPRRERMQELLQYLTGSGWSSQIKNKEPCQNCDVPQLDAMGHTFQFVEVCLYHFHNDNDHSFSQFSVHKALTCPEGWSSKALATTLFGEKETRPVQK